MDTPITIGSLELKMNCGRTFSLAGNTATCLEKGRGSHGAGLVREEVEDQGRTVSCMFLLLELLLLSLLVVLTILGEGVKQMVDDLG